MAKNRQKRPKITVTWYSFRKPLTFFIIVLNIVIIAFGGPGLHIKPWYCQWDYVFELFFYLQIGCDYNYYTIVNHQFFTSFYKSWPKISNLTNSQIKHMNKYVYLLNTNFGFINATGLKKKSFKYSFVRTGAIKLRMA